MSGKRKQAIARATLKPGTGQVRVNKVVLEVFQPRLARDKIGEPLVLAGTVAHDVDIDIITRGGGFMSQAEAGRLALAKALAKYDKKLESLFLSYDRHLMVADVRRKEPSKPNRHGQARAKVQKSYR